jgi:hypothetical protein
MVNKPGSKGSSLLKNEKITRHNICSKNQMPVIAVIVALAVICILGYAFYKFLIGEGGSTPRTRLVNHDRYGNPVE